MNTVHPSYLRASKLVDDRLLGGAYQPMIMEFWRFLYWGLVVDVDERVEDVLKINL